MRFKAATVLMTLAWAAVYGQPAATGIRPLDAAQFDRAKHFLDASDAPMAIIGTSLFNNPVAIREQVLGHAKEYRSPEFRYLNNRFTLGTAVAHFPFRFQIVTPFARVVYITLLARQNHVDPTYPSIDQLNAILPAVVVTPGSDVAMMDDIQNVVIRRAGATEQPLESTLQNVMVREPHSETGKTIKGGHFAFPFRTWEPSEPLVIVLIGKSRTIEWPMTLAELALLH